MRAPLDTSPEVHAVADLHKDLARSHRIDRLDQPGHAGGPGAVPADVLQADLDAIERDGYVVLPSLLDAGEVQRTREALTGLLGPLGRNNFEGHLTQRVYSVLGKTRVADELVEHPRVLALLDRLLMPNQLLSQLQVINILPGEKGQLAHADDLFYPVPRPRAALSVSTIWAIDEFTSDNGATIVFPGSHRWGEGRQPVDSDRRLPAVMPAGSCILFLGTLWHGGGANVSDGSRMAVTAQYCEPWLRTQESFTLSVDRDTARALSPRIRRMIGYSVHPPFMGSVNGLHPERLLES